MKTPALPLHAFYTYLLNTYCVRVLLYPQGDTHETKTDKALFSPGAGTLVDGGRMAI